MSILFVLLKFKFVKTFCDSTVFIFFGGAQGWTESSLHLLSAPAGIPAAHKPRSQEPTSLYEVS